MRFDLRFLCVLRLTIFERPGPQHLQDPNGQYGKGHLAQHRHRRHRDLRRHLRALDGHGSGRPDPPRGIEGIAVK